MEYMTEDKKNIKIKHDCGIPETLSSESAGITKDKARYQGRWRDGEVPNELSVGLAKTGVDKCVYKVLKYYLNLVVSTL